ETVYQTKTELERCLQKNGTLIYNSDDALLSRLNTEWKGRRVTFGRGEDAQVRIAEGETPALVHDGRRHEIPLELMPHNRFNAAAAAGAALALGWTWEEIEAGLVAWKPLPMRMQTEIRGRSKFILDAYNANPSSMKAAIAGLLDKSSKRPLVAVLGDMRELGCYSQQYHAELGKWLAGLDIDRIFLAGPEMRHAYDAARSAGAAGRSAYAAAPDGWIADLAKISREGGTFLIKASRAMEFEKILEKL
ncbi:MAG: cyanophycin synthetase, partial [Elusimicrobiales bacterium]|nr:cyanophycin synthetase [Elusimicrobiales bacterium]